jgi:VanZ family protein
MILGAIVAAKFEWTPFVEYYQETTGAALQDALVGLLSYGLLAALWPRRAAILWANILAGGIETAQIFLPTRSAGIKDIVIAGPGAWIGYRVAKATTDCADFTKTDRFDV